MPIWSNLAALQGFLPTAHGNMPRGVLEALHRRKRELSLTTIRGMDDSPQQRALLRHKGKDRKYHTTFFGRPTGEFGDVQEGWYDRPETWYERSGPVIQTGKNKGKKKVQRHGGGSPRLLVAALPRTHHRPILAGAWDKAVIKAGKNLGDYLHAELNDRLAWQARRSINLMPQGVSDFRPSDYVGERDFLA